MGYCRIAVVTGGNKGIGLEICRQLASKGVTVILTARDERRGLEAVEGLKASGLYDIIFHKLDVVQQSSAASLAAFIKQRFGRLDILYISNEKAFQKLGDADGLTEDTVDEVVKEFLEDAKEDQIESKGWPKQFSAYKVSKASINAYTRILANKYPNISINAVNPGFVSTDINLHTGILPVEEGARGAIMLALMPDGGPSGQYFDRTEQSTF
ncbi:hypothetical protein Nepgr_004462 [Nepenthes gracilis]|uniref:(+)-neomenthol dehydrogenase n=1 Tax=Nepenthes gracilis TaxID=150966 RepID=A0AAD3XF76_NEPGR|nr:hypothetical protein Nepgr_004462 [Nepenthes gracilis]